MQYRNQNQRQRKHYIQVSQAAANTTTKDPYLKSRHTKSKNAASGFIARVQIELARAQSARAGIASG
jgi:coproporphyrinogen III oxidase-like Fe-S oxidoreductase